MDIKAKLTCLEFTLVYSANKSTLKLFRSFIRNNSQLAENKDIRTLKEWSSLFNDFISK